MHTGKVLFLPEFCEYFRNNVFCVSMGIDIPDSVTAQWAVIMIEHKRESFPWITFKGFP